MPWIMECNGMFGKWKNCKEINIITFDEKLTICARNTAWEEATSVTSSFSTMFVKYELRSNTILKDCRNRYFIYDYVSLIERWDAGIVSKQYCMQSQSMKISKKQSVLNRNWYFFCGSHGLTEFSQEPETTRQNSKIWNVWTQHTDTGNRATEVHRQS